MRRQKWDDQLGGTQMGSVLQGGKNTDVGT